MSLMVVLPLAVLGIGSLLTALAAWRVTVATRRLAGTVDALGALEAPRRTLDAETVIANGAIGRVADPGRVPDQEWVSARVSGPVAGQGRILDASRHR